MAALIGTTFGFLPKDVFVAYQDTLKQSPRTTLVFTQKSVLPFMRDEVAKVNRYPGPVVYADNGKLRWKSDKQRRFVIAFKLEKDSEGNIIPYQRKGTFFDTVEVVLDVSKGALQIRNINPISIFVTGQFQQPFHDDTGWQKDDERYAAAMEATIDLLIDGWFSIIDFPSLA